MDESVGNASHEGQSVKTPSYFLPLRSDLTISAIRNTLSNLSPSVEETYERIFSAIEKENRKYCTPNLAMDHTCETATNEYPLGRAVIWTQLGVEAPYNSTEPPRIERLKRHDLLYFIILPYININYL
jgi:hypothetical protein